MTGPTRVLQRDIRRISDPDGTGVVDAEVTVPPDEVWLIKGISIRYEAEAGGNARRVRTDLVVSGESVAGSESPVDIAATETVLFTFGPGNPLAAVKNGAVEGTATVPLIEFVLNAGDIIRASEPTANGTAGDSLSLSVHTEVKYL